MIAAAISLALLIAAGILLSLQLKDSNKSSGSLPPNVRLMESADLDDDILLQQIEELNAYIDNLKRERAQQEFDYTALQSEKDALERKSAALEEQNRYLRERNSSLNISGIKLRDDIAALDNEIAALNEKLSQLSKEREANEEAYQKALAKIEEYQARRPDTQAVPAETSTSRNYSTIPSGQSRNILGLKIGPSDIDLEATFAIMPHWFLIADLGAVETPDDFVETEFPGLTADNSFLYTALFGTGLNWRFNNIQSQPNFYIAAMAGPAWYFYREDGENDLKTYLLLRSSVGFDMTLYKNLQFTTDVSVDWMKDYGFTPRLTLGLQWSFSNRWSLIHLYGCQEQICRRKPRHQAAHLDLLSGHRAPHPGEVSRVDRQPYPLAGATRHHGHVYPSQNQGGDGFEGRPNWHLLHHPLCRKDRCCEKPCGRGEIACRRRHQHGLALQPGLSRNQEARPWLQGTETARFAALSRWRADLIDQW